MIFITLFEISLFFSQINFSVGYEMKNTETIKSLYQLKKEVEKSDHHLLVTQINEVIKKVHYQYNIVSFIGHFSSGKSSLINKICNEEILPSSPIPTTSNTAQIISDDKSLIRINMENQTYTDVDDYKTVKQVNTANTQIESVEIHKDNLTFQKGTVIQDTPGIDATFKNHEESTLKYLLISDVVFYTVEYNHVNSEKNFNQIKEMNKLGVPVILVINQIDKHNENELSFEAFEQTIQNNINLWGLAVEQIIYTSIFECEHNQFIQLESTLKEVINENIKNRDGYYDRIIKYIEASQTEYLKEKKAALLSKLEIDESEVENASERSKSQETLNEQIQLLTADDNSERIIEEVRKIITNAYLMPFELREKIAEMLETFAQNYKVGGLFGKQAKLQNARNTTTEKVVVMLNDILDKQINFQLRHFYDQFSKYSDTPSLLNEIRYTVTVDDVQKHIKVQPEVTKDYVLIFSEQLKKYFEQFIVQNQKSWIQKFIKSINLSKINNDSGNHQSSLFHDYFENEKLITSITTRNYMHYYIHIDESIDKLIDRSYVTLNLKSENEIPHMTQQKNNGADEQVELETQVLQMFNDVAYFKPDIEKLEAQLRRIQEDVTKIVVFGAFSAGKSALINAMLKEEILKSSPNPTTASITELYYGDKHYVTFKSEEVLLNKLNSMTSITHPNYQSIQEWIKQNKRHFKILSDEDKSFAQGIIDNYSIYKSYIINASTIEIDKNEIEKYTAEDSHAAFVNKIKIGIENEFLKNKIIIDSPGTGSTNSRHTMETTEIIADSDLLLYVSYYNHVYTEKDKAFLTYLNEIEVMNEESKNFFVINAVDLRKNDDELDLVTNYLKNELSQLNIHDAIYPVSSKSALTQYDERFRAFVSDVEHFVSTTSRVQKIKQFNMNAHRLLRNAESMVTNYESFKEQQALQQNQYNEWLQNEPLPENIITNIATNLERFLHEQVTYLKDKIKIQLYDIIKSEINTSQLNAAMENQYKNAVATKLISEFQFIVPRLNKAAQTYYKAETALISEQLMKYNITEDVSFKLPILMMQDIKLSSIAHEIEKISLPAIKEKQLMDMKLRDTLFTQIHALTMNEMEQILKQFELMMNKNLKESELIIKQHINNMNHQINLEIDDKLQTKLDDHTVFQIKQILES